MINDNVCGISSFANMELKIDVFLPAYIRISWLQFVLGSQHLCITAEVAPTQVPLFLWLFSNISFLPPTSATVICWNVNDYVLVIFRSSWPLSPGPPIMRNLRNSLGFVVYFVVIPQTAHAAWNSLRIRLPFLYLVTPANFPRDKISLVENV